MFCSLKYGMLAYIQGRSLQKMLTSERDYNLVRSFSGKF